jgi:RND superfamily putative drug exporter
MFEKLGAFVFHRRKAVLALFVIALIGFGVMASLAIPKLSGGGYSVPGSDAAIAASYLTETFHVQDPAVVLEVKSSGLITDSAVVASAAALEKSIAAEKGVARTLSYWSTGNAPTLASNDQHAAFLFIYSSENSLDKAQPLGKLIASKYDGSFQNLHVYVNGLATINSALSDRVAEDLHLAESISVPLIFLLLLFVFGGLVAAVTPLIVGVGAIVGSLGIIYLVTLATGVSVFALNMITGLGVGLGIDYALLIVNRYREELYKGESTQVAIRNTIMTAGKTVFFSGVTVFFTLASLTFFPLMFLKSFGYAGMSVVACAMLVALVPFPAILAMMGPGIDKFAIRKGVTAQKSDGGWAHVARFVMRRPAAIVVLTLIIMTIIASPIRNIAFSQADARAMPATSAIAIANATAARDFPGQAGNPIQFIVPNGTENESQLASYKAKIAAEPGVVLVSPDDTVGTSVHFSAIHSMGPRTSEAEALIKSIRALPSPAGTLVGGAAASYTDSQDAIFSTLPLVLTWIAIGVLILLFLFTGSIILPIKAVLLNIVSLAAMMGALTWIFQEGHLGFLVGSFTKTHDLDTSILILISIVTFGLSMDYEVFLLSRIKEEFESGKSNDDSIAFGVQRSARMITAAALLLSIAFAAFVTSGVTNLKVLGFGVAFAVLIDASVVRVLLVPALLHLFGSRTWWAPAWMKRFTISES